MVNRRRRVPRDGAADPFGSPHGVALLERYHAQQVHGLGLVRLRSQDAAVDFRRLVKLAPLVMLDRRSQFVRHGNSLFACGTGEPVLMHGA